MILNLLIIAVILIFLYVRYVPVRGVPYIERTEDFHHKDILLLDLRGYTEARNNPIMGASNLPLAYLKRHYHTIKVKNLVIIASDPVCKNLGARFLKRKGFKVLGYTLTSSKTHECMNILDNTYNHS